MANDVRSVCPFCSMGCTMLLGPGSGAPYSGEADIPRLDYDAEGPFNRGSLCAKGNMSLELLTHPGRLETPWIRTDDYGAPASWDEALGHVAASLHWIRERSGPEAIGLVLGPHLTNEEGRAALELARRLGTPHVDGGLPEDRALLGGIAASGACPQVVTDIEQLEKMTAILLVGDVFTVAPCLAKAVLEARYDRRQNRLGTLQGVPSRTGWFGRPSLRCAPAHEAAAVALLLSVALERAESNAPWVDAARAALTDRPLEALSGLDAASCRAFVDALAAAESSGVVVASAFGATERPDLLAGLSSLLAEATGSRLLSLPQGGNAAGLHAVLAGASRPPAGRTTPQMLEAALTGDLDALLVFGMDPVGAFPGPLAREVPSRLRLLVVTAPLESESTPLASVVLPTTTWGEKQGTVTNAFGADLALARALAPTGASRSEGEVIQALAERIEPWRSDGQEDLATKASPVAAEPAFFSDLELYFRLERREAGARAAPGHLLLPQPSVSHAADGSWTRSLSWPRHETPVPELSLSPSHARRLRVRTGDRLRVRSNQGEVVLGARVEPRLGDQVVLAPAHEPGVRRLVRWSLDPVARDLVVEPPRVSVERDPENGDD